jgi:hypothetical protein
MAAADAPESYLIYVRPRAGLLRNGILSFLVVSIPVFGALYLLGVPGGSWPIVLGFQLLTLVLAAVCYWRYRRTFVAVTTDNSIQERGFFVPFGTVPVSEVRSGVLVNTYRSSSSDTVLQLVLLGNGGKRLLRMRGSFWTEADMRAITTAIDVPVSVRPDAISTSALFEDYPGSAYWFENRPVLAVLIATAMGLSVLALVLGLMSVVGIPIEGVDN